MGDPCRERRRKVIKRCVLFGVVLMVLAGGVALALPNDGASLNAALAVEKWQYAGDEAVNVTFSLANESDRTLYVLGWQTPLGGIEADVFEVEVDGMPVPYIGKLVKRPAPQPEDYVAIGAGERVAVVFDLAEAYDMTREGEYTIRYSADLDINDVPVATRKYGKSLMVPEAVVLVESNAVSLFAAAREQRLGLDLYAMGVGAYYGCSSSQQSTLSTALSNATTISGKAKTWLANNPSGGAYFVKWFGAYTSARFSTVTSHFNAIYSSFTTKSIDFDCSTCTMTNAYAYVYATQPYRIYLCGYFWKAPATGRDSKAGTLVHEDSHFNVVASTSDYVYGETKALQLAKTQPKKAINNADNHEYFAEDQK